MTNIEELQARYLALTDAEKFDEAIPVYDEYLAAKKAAREEKAPDTEREPAPVPTHPEADVSAKLDKIEQTLTQIALDLASLSEHLGVR